MGKNKDDQEKVLKAAGLSFSDARGTVLAALLHACKYNGEDLFQGNVVRVSGGWNALFTHDRVGIFAVGIDPIDDDDDVGAAGSPLSPELKN